MYLTNISGKTLFPNLQVITFVRKECHFHVHFESETRYEAEIISIDGWNLGKITSDISSST